MVLLAKIWKAMPGWELSLLIIPWENGVVEAPSCVLPVACVFFLSYMS